jgi:hypothetical protein
MVKLLSGRSMLRTILCFANVFFYIPGIPAMFWYSSSFSLCLWISIPFAVFSIFSYLCFAGQRDFLAEEKYREEDCSRVSCFL